MKRWHLTVFYRMAAAGILLVTAMAIGSRAHAEIDLFGASSDSGGQGQKAGESLVQVHSLFSYSSALPGKTYAAALVVTVVPAWHINSSKPHQEWLIPAALAFDTVPGAVPDGIVYPLGSDAFLAGETMSVYDGRIVIPFRVTIAADAAVGQITLPVRFTYQPCNDKECRPPQTVPADLAIAVGGEGEPLAPEVFAPVAFDQPPSGPIEPPAEQTDLQRLIDTYGFWGYLMALGLAFVTGLLLSFSPCTYPMIPITVSIFAGQQRSIGRGFVLSLFYVGTMAVVYGIMGLIVSLVGGVFGAWLASPTVVIGIAVIFVIFALSMFGLYELQVPSSLRQKLGTGKAKGGVLGSIILGIVAALVVSPCVGPFVAGILLYVATTGSPVIGFLVLFIFALGLGTLFVIIGTFSSAVQALPGAGQWMESIKKFFGFVLLLMALYFLRPILSTTLSAMLTGLLLLALGVFGGGLDRLTAEATFFPRLKKFVGLVALLAGVYFLAGSMITSGVILPPGSEWFGVDTSERGEDGQGRIMWETDLATGLARAQAEQKPVLIDTWATWCVNCRVMEKKTFNHPDVVAEAARFIPLKIQLETADSPVTKAFMERFGWKQYSLPTTLLLDAGGRTRRTFRGVIGPQEMVAAMRQVR
jgi:thiol:disulfide interchange protein DsbD